MKMQLQGLQQRMCRQMLLEYKHESTFQRAKISLLQVQETVSLL